MVLLRLARWRLLARRDLRPGQSGWIEQQGVGLVGGRDLVARPAAQLAWGVLEESDDVVVRDLDLVLAGAVGQAQADQQVVFERRLAGARHQTGRAVSVPGPTVPNSASIAPRMVANDAPEAAICLVRRVMSTHTWQYEACSSKTTEPPACCSK